jgi:hypothetical protein
MAVLDLIASLPRQGVVEISENLIIGRGTRFERTVSHGHASQDRSWYDHGEGESVVFLSGDCHVPPHARGYPGRVHSSVPVAADPGKTSSPIYSAAR